MTDHFRLGGPPPPITSDGRTYVTFREEGMERTRPIIEVIMAGYVYGPEGGPEINLRIGGPAPNPVVPIEVIREVWVKPPNAKKSHLVWRRA